MSAEPSYIPSASPSTSAEPVDGGKVGDEGVVGTNDYDNRSTVYITDSRQSNGLSTATIVGTVFATLLAAALCWNVIYLCLYCRSRNTSVGEDYYDTKITVSELKDGQVLVKTVLKHENGTETVQKTVYPDKQTAADHGFFPDY